MGLERQGGTKVKPLQRLALLAVSFLLGLVLFRLSAKLMIAATVALIAVFLFKKIRKKLAAKSVR